jgi:Fructose-2,6-bisphosphatase
MIEKDPIRLILVRHGNTFESGQQPVQVGALSDLPLTAQGFKQAHDFAGYLKRKGIEPKAIYAGTLVRQTESAKIVGKELHMEKKVHINEPALTEIDYGLWEGLAADEIEAKWPHEYEQWNTQAKWAEDIFGGTLQGHLEAIAHWLDMLCKTYDSGDTVVAVTSNGVIRFFYSFVKDDWQAVVNTKQMENLKVKTGHFCELLIYKDALKVQTWNAAV